MIFDRAQFGRPGQPKMPAQQMQRDDRVLALGMAHTKLESEVEGLRAEVASLREAILVLAQRVTEPAPGIVDLNEPTVDAGWPDVDSDSDE